MSPSLARITSCLFLTLAVSGCGEPERPDSADDEHRIEGEAASAVPTGDGGRGSHDPALARRGEALYRDKGCAACHALGEGRLVGPDLLGVTERRDHDWIIAMIVRPDSMLRADPTARELLSEYYTPMQNMGVSREEAEALVHYLRRKTEDEGGDP